MFSFTDVVFNFDSSEIQIFPFFFFFFFAFFTDYEFSQMRFPLTFWCVLFFGWSFFLRPSFCDSREDFSDTCPEFSCGEVKNVSYPFWNGDNSENCGRRGLKLNCHADDHQYFTMEMNSLDYRVISISTTTHTMKIARSDLYDSRCTRNFTNSTLDLSLLNYSPNLRNLTVFYNCTNQSLKSNETLSRNRFNCTYNSSETVNFFFSDESMMENMRSELNSCHNKIIVPAFPESENGAKDIDSAFHGGFAVTYDILGMASTCDACRNSGGLCRSNDSFPFLCWCRGQAPQPFNKCPAPDIKNVRKKIVIGVCSGLGGILLTCFVFLIWAYRTNNKYVFSTVVPRSFSSYFSSQSTVEKECIYAGVHLFSYSDLEEATNKFDSVNELGDGGFGTVYYGKLRDGRTVAVKRLHENNFKRVEQFRNEVEILSRLRHENLVSLYGCTSRQCHELLLVYEYIPNGTVADHLHGNRAKPGELRWSTRMKIAIETASALVYLHASDIIHRDIKTSNILLDHNFHVKVADFGLSRPFPTNASHISTAPQGTPGYLDPEYNECYQLTDKSDVYSFGVVLMELISSKPAVDLTRHKQEINLSTMAINKILNCALNELVDPHLNFGSDNRIREMISSLAELAFQCLQSVKDARPSMADVLEALHHIENGDCSKEKSVDIDNNVSEELLKKKPLIFAQDTGDVHWFSASATPSSSR